MWGVMLTFYRTSKELHRLVSFSKQSRMCVHQCGGKQMSTSDHTGFNQFIIDYIRTLSLFEKRKTAHWRSIEWLYVTHILALHTFYHMPPSINICLHKQLRWHIFQENEYVYFPKCQCTLSSLATWVPGNMLSRSVRSRSWKFCCVLQ